MQGFGFNKITYVDGVIIYGINGKPISARTPNQQALVETFGANVITMRSIIVETVAGTKRCAKVLKMHRFAGLWV